MLVNTLNFSVRGFSPSLSGLAFSVAAVPCVLCDRNSLAVGTAVTVAAKFLQYETPTTLTPYLRYANPMTHLCRSLGEAVIPPPAPFAPCSDVNNAEDHREEPYECALVIKLDYN